MVGGKRESAKMDLKNRPEMIWIIEGTPEKVLKPWEEIDDTNFLPKKNVKENIKIKAPRSTETRLGTISLLKLN